MERNKETYKDVIISTGIRFVSFIFIVLKLSFLISCLVLISKFHSIYTSARDYTCSDDTTIFILSYVDEYLENAQNYNWIGLTAVLVIAFGEIVAIGILFIFQKRAEKQARESRESLLDSLANSKQ